MRPDIVILREVYPRSGAQNDEVKDAYIDTLGWAYTRLGQVNEALPMLNRVVEKAPDVAVFQYHLGSALFQKGDRVAAKSLLQKAASSPQEFPGKKEAKGMLEKV